MKPTLFLLAAGMGSRYGGLKQLDGLGPSGETIMDYSIYDAIQAGFGKIVWVIRKDFEEQFRTQILLKYEGQVPCELCFQSLDALPEGFSVPEGRVKPWGTNHAVLMGKDVIKEPFCVINCDDFYGRDAFMTMGRFLMSQTDLNTHHYAMVGYQLNKTLSEFGTVSRGICETNDRHELTAITEMTKIRRYEDGIKNVTENGEVTLLSETAPVSMNFWGFMPNIFSLTEKMFVDFLKENNDNPKSEFFIPLVVNYLISSKTATIQVLESDAEWFGVTYQEDRPSVVEKLKSVKY